MTLADGSGNELFTQTGQTSFLTWKKETAGVNHFLVMTMKD